MTIFDGSLAGPLWQWFYQNLADLGFLYDAGYNAWRGSFRGEDFYVFAAEPFLARFSNRTEDLCEVLARMDRTTPEKIRKRIAAAYRKAGGEIPQGASFTDGGRRYTRIAARVRERYGVKE
jgi:hypothetical protein